MEVDNKTREVYAQQVQERTSRGRARSSQGAIQISEMMEVDNKTQMDDMLNKYKKGERGDGEEGYV
jgi:hypothetical protein